MYLIAVIDMLNIGFSAREARWDRMGAHVARLLGDGAGSLASVYSDHELFPASRLFSPDPHDRAEISAVGSDSNFMRSK
jgi:hypothetical protein